MKEREVQPELQKKAQPESEEKKQLVKPKLERHEKLPELTGFGFPGFS